MPKRLLGPLCVFVVCGILTLGLWPFHSPANDVRWLKGAHGLSLDGEGTLFSEPSLDFRGTTHSIEVWASTRIIRAGATLLAVYNPNSKDCATVSVTRSVADLKIQTRQENSYFDIVKHKFYVDDVFQPDEPLFLTITFSTHGTRLYVNGVPRSTSSSFTIPDCTVAGSRLVLGDSAGQSDGWVGEIRGLAIYQTELAEDQVKRHFETWTTSGRPVWEGSNGNRTLYLFDEGEGSVAHDQGNGKLRLEMPARYAVIDKQVLAGFWDEFSGTTGYWLDFANNVIGFVPVGFCFCAYLANNTRLRHPVRIAVLLGVGLSLTIELTQPFLATRESDMTDLITNTVGTIAGAALYVRSASWYQRQFHRSFFY